MLSPAAPSRLLLLLRPPSENKVPIPAGGPPDVGGLGEVSRGVHVSATPLREGSAENPSVSVRGMSQEASRRESSSTSRSLGNVTVPGAMIARSAAMRT